MNGQPIGKNVADASCWNREVIRTFKEPFKANAGIAVLRGNLAPDGAVIKPSAASPHLLQHRGRAVVFETIEEFHARINDESLDIDENCVMVLKNCGPRGYPGMAEVGNMMLPPKILRKGVNDMVRISDARMSGTAYGTVVLHACPEAAAGGPLALVQSGDMITLDVPKRLLRSGCRRRRSRRPSGKVDASTASRSWMAEALCRTCSAGGQRRRPRFPRGSAVDRTWHATRIDQTPPSRGVDETNHCVRPEWRYSSFDGLELSGSTSGARFLSARERLKPGRSVLIIF